MIIFLHCSKEKHPVLSQHMQQQHPAVEIPRKGHFPPQSYSNVLDGRTMASNNLEITLVDPKKAGLIGNNSKSRGNSAMSQQSRHQPHPNGKSLQRVEPVSPYTPRKPIHPVIPNVPNLSHFNNPSSYGRTSAQGNVDKRKVPDTSREHQRRNELR